MRTKFTQLDEAGIPICQKVVNLGEGYLNVHYTIGTFFRFEIFQNQNMGEMKISV